MSLTDQKHLDKARRDDLRGKAFALYLDGYTYREIATELNDVVSHTSIFDWIKLDVRELAKLRVNELGDQREVIALQLDSVIKSAKRDLDSDVGVIIEGDPDKPDEQSKKFVDRINTDAAKVLMEALKTKAKLFGINAPEKKEIKIEHSLSDLLKLTDGVDTQNVIEGEFEEVDDDA